ncbi:MAG: DUF1080 domain-containing protein [Bryobacterales bacterium]|nr:DUF1080 domain-containing protein [Bryobacterales bacterium]
MRVLFVGAMAAALWSQQPPAAAPAKPAEELAGDDTNGYTDTPRIPGQRWRVHDVDRPRPPKVTPGAGAGLNTPPPSDAIVLFNGKDLSQWISEARGGKPQAPKWKVENGYVEIVPKTGRLVTKEKFGDCQLHVEWMIPKSAGGTGQSRGNSGVELMRRYEIQVLESNQNLTYADGGAGAIYGVWPPMVNPARPQGEWNAYDIFFQAPRFEGETLVQPAVLTLFFNGVLVQDHKAYLGTTVWRRVGTYRAHAAEEPLSLQDHNQAVRFRNIWIRRLGRSGEN